jgi:hypothetical protein
VNGLVSGGEVSGEVGNRRKGTGGTKNQLDHLNLPASSPSSTSIILNSTIIDLYSIMMNKTDLV